MYIHIHQNIFIICHHYSHFKWHKGAMRITVALCYMNKHSHPWYQ